MEKSSENKKNMDDGYSTGQNWADLGLSGPRYQECEATKRLTTCLQVTAARGTHDVSALC